MDVPPEAEWRIYVPWIKQSFVSSAPRHYRPCQVHSEFCTMKSNLAVCISVEMSMTLGDLFVVLHRCVLHFSDHHLIQNHNHIHKKWQSDNKLDIMTIVAVGSIQALHINCLHYFHVASIVFSLQSFNHKWQRVWQAEEVFQIQPFSRVSRLGHSKTCRQELTMGVSTSLGLSLILRKM